MAVLSLPLSFNHSFWSQDYRRGLQVLFNKLDQGAAENAQLVAFIRARANAENNLAFALMNPTPTSRPGTGFDVDDGASLLMTFRGLQAESAAQGKAHKTISNELNTLVADPFEHWALSHSDRIKENQAVILGDWLRSYEMACAEVAKLKQQYLAKTRRADDLEDDVKFSPNKGELGDKYTSSPRLRPADRPQRSASVSERIAERLKVLQKKSTLTEDALPAPSETGPATEVQAPNIDKGKGRAIEGQQPTPASPLLSSPTPMSPMLPPRVVDNPLGEQTVAPIILAGLSFPPSAVSQLLLRAQAELPLKPVRFPLIGEYQESFTGEEFVGWLNESVPGFGGNLDHAEDAARELTEREGLLRRLGELGNQFEHSDEAFYQFRPKAFELGKDTEPVGAAPAALTNIKTLQPENLRKQTATFANFVSKALNAGQTEPAYVRARHEADEADDVYRIAVRKLDRQRLKLEETLEETLKVLQKWETERLRAVKTVLLQYQGTVANLPKALDPPIERSSTLIAAFQPETDLTALIERYRTGPFRPNPQVYESVAHDESDVVFGIDLRKWSGGAWDGLSFTGQSEERKDKETIPPVVSALLGALKEAYKALPDDVKRNSWIYEVPLPAVHHLREALNGAPPDQPIPLSLVTKYDAPVIASTLKLWALELDPPLVLYEGWDEFRKLYRAKAEGQPTEEEHLQNLSALLQKLPRVHLYVLDSIVRHLKELIDTTKTDETDEVSITKLALSVGRTIIRPKVETELSIQDRHPTLLFIDLLTNYEVIFPPTIARKKRESERKVPIRKRTAPVDMRMSRSRISLNADAQQLFAAQKGAQNPAYARKAPEVLSPPSRQSVVLPPAAGPVPPPPPPPVLPHAPVIAEPPVPKPSPPIVAPPSPTPPPPPPAAVTPLVPPPPPPSQPNRPSFKEPPPEFDDSPPRPTFKEPPPELDNGPGFPAEAEEPSTPAQAHTPLSVMSPPPTPSVVPPTPHQNIAAKPGPKFGSRSPTPPEDLVLSSGRTSLSRNTSGQSQLRGPRLARGPRVAGGSVSTLVSNLNNRSSVGGASPPGTSPPKSSSPVAGVRAANRLSGSPVRRPSSVLGRSSVSSSFTRRTMASDAEDEVVG